MKKAPRTSGPPPTFSHSTFGQQNQARHPPAQPSGGQQTREGAPQPQPQPVVSAPAHQPRPSQVTAAAAGGQQPAGAALGQHGAGYYHQHFYNGAPVMMDQDSVHNFYGHRTGGSYEM